MYPRLYNNPGCAFMVLFATTPVGGLLLLLVGIPILLVYLSYDSGLPIWGVVLVLVATAVLSCILTRFLTLWYLRHVDEFRTKRLREAFEQMPKDWVPSTDDPEAAALEFLQFLHQQKRNLFYPKGDKHMMDSEHTPDILYENYKDMPEGPERERAKRLYITEDTKKFIREMLEPKHPITLQQKERYLQGLFSAIYYLGYRLELHRHKTTPSRPQ